MTVIGTITHELGHYSVSKLLGYEARINYQSSTSWDNDLEAYLKDTYEKYSVAIKDNKEFPGKAEYFKTIQKLKTDNLWITFGGPLQTIITGTIGLILLLFYRRNYISDNKVHFIGWTLIFVSLFWLRQVANLFMAIMTYLKEGKVTLSGDEMQLAYYLGINIWTIQIITGLLGISVLLIILYVIPKKLVPTFLFSGLVGGMLGYYLWLIKFGQYIMP